MYDPIDWLIGIVGLCIYCIVVVLKCVDTYMWFENTSSSNIGNFFTRGSGVGALHVAHIIFSTPFHFFRTFLFPLSFHSFLCWLRRLVGSPRHKTVFCVALSSVQHTLPNTGRKPTLNRGNFYLLERRNSQLKMLLCKLVSRTCIVVLCCDVLYQEILSLPPSLTTTFTWHTPSYTREHRTFLVIVVVVGLRAVSSSFFLDRPARSTHSSVI